jgi:uncharacterized alkaline shock family protein YloU
VSTPTPDHTPVGQPPGDPGQHAAADPPPDIVVVVPVEGPVEVPVAVEDPVEAPIAVPVPVVVTETVVVPASGAGAGRWSGKVIDAVAHTADEVAALVLSVPGVVRLHAGMFGEAATYLPGRRVAGIKLGDDLVEVHIVVAHGTPIRDTAQRIHTVVAAAVAAPVHVFVEDIDAP